MNYTNIIQKLWNGTRVLLRSFKDWKEIYVELGVLNLPPFTISLLDSFFPVSCDFIFLSFCSSPCTSRLFMCHSKWAHRLKTIYIIREHFHSTTRDIWQDEINASANEWREMIEEGMRLRILKQTLINNIKIFILLEDYETKKLTKWILPINSSLDVIYLWHPDTI